MSSSTSLVPAPKRVVSIKKKNTTQKINSFNENGTTFKNREEVRKYLPDILGRVLAKIWLDPEFHALFSDDPEGTLSDNGIVLPPNMSIEFQRRNSDRPRIVVFEKREGVKFKMRVLYLQLVMMAGR